MKILIILALAIIVFLVINRMRANNGGSASKGQARTTKRVSAPAQEQPYRATSIVPGKNPCEAVKLLAQRKYLLKEGDTPLLPLEDCTATKCTCKYTHRKDRRDIGEDRRIATGLLSDLYTTSGENEERRSTQSERRNSDND